MEESIALWIVPLTFLPGIGALILSTSNRFFHVNGLIRTEIKDNPGNKEYVQKLLKRSELFHGALACLYLAIASFSIASLLANIYTNWILGHMTVRFMSDGLVLLGVVLVVMASIQLIRESFLSARALRKQVEDS